MNVENVFSLVMELMDNLDIAYGTLTHVLWREVTMLFFMRTKCINKP